MFPKLLLLEKSHESKIIARLRKWVGSYIQNNFFSVANQFWLLQRSWKKILVLSEDEK